MEGAEEVLKNYTLIQPTGVKADIYNDWIPTEYVVSSTNENGWLNSDFVLRAAEGYVLSFGNTVDGKWVSHYTDSNETSEGNVSFYLRNTETGAISKAVTESYKIDKTVPVISGLENGKTYYTTQKFIITEKNLEKITVNNEIWTKDMLSGNTDAVYTITVADKAGNVTTVTVNMKPIGSISAPINGLTEENVTGDNAETCKSVENVLNSLDITNATEEEKQVIVEVLAKVDALQKVIEDTADEVGDLKETASAYDKESVKSTDEEVINQLLTDIEEKLQDANLTESQKAELEQVLEEVKALADQIYVGKVMKEIQEVDSKINGMEDETEIPDKEEIVDAVLKVLENYQKLDERQKELVGSEKKQLLDDALRKIVAYKIIEGVDGIYTQETLKELEFKANGLFKLFKAVRVDKNVLADEKIARFLEKNGGNIIKTIVVKNKLTNLIVK